MSKPLEEHGSEEKKNIQNLMHTWSENDIKRSAERSRRKLDQIINSEHVEENLKHRSKERAREREEIRTKRRKKNSPVESADSSGDAIYETKAALKKKRSRRKRREGIIARTVRLVKGLAAVQKELKGRYFVNEEQELRLYRKVIWDAWGPLLAVFVDARDTFWDFLCKLGRDSVDIVRAIIKIISVIWDVLLAIFDKISDKVWDILFYMEQHKRRLFNIFSSVVSSIAVVLIAISSVSAYEYSYYGKTLGIAKSKQEIYRTIDVLGDKLSEVNGANVNINVERDIEFKRIFGFNLNVDSSDKILNTLTYMKDLQALGYAIKIDGETAVIMESEDVAKDVISNFRNNYAGVRTGVEYNAINFLETITIDTVQVLLGDIWNPNDALNYLETGKTSALEEGEEKNPLLHVHSVEVATYEEDVPFENEFIENSAIYADEISLISAGVTGKERIVAEITRENGEEINKTILSSTRVANPINAVYYQGTKPIPPTMGTGYFIFPLSAGTEYFQSAYFGEFYGVVGVAEQHGGNDYACAEGSFIHAADGGVVTFAGYASGYGYMVQINHGGLIESIYGHCSELFVHTGDEVYQGQHIANSGNTGISTGPHLHFETRYKGMPIDPDSLLYR